jgi:hypothetical protein
MQSSALVGYEHYYQMLSDHVRMDAFRQAITAVVRPGDVVVDLGAGTGILGFWALRAGARKVYAIEKSDAIELAQQIARHNGFADRVEFIQRNVLEVQLPERADVLISETLGSLGIDENTVQATIYARDHLLIPQGRMIPSGLSILAAPAESDSAYQKLDCWRHVTDVDFSPAFELFSRKIMVESIPATDLMSEAVELGHLDLRVIDRPTFAARAYFQMKRSGLIHGVAGWFEAQLSANAAITTAPDQPATHWKQAFMPFHRPIKVVRGDVLDWTMELAPKASGDDSTTISYRYRCTQLQQEERKRTEKLEKIAAGTDDPCPCGSGKQVRCCCGAR